MRFEVETNLYNPSALAKKFSSIQTNFDVTLGKISAIISDSDIEQYQDGHTTMNSRLSSAIQDLDGFHQQVSKMQITYDGQFESVDNRLTTFDTTLNGITADVSSVSREAIKTDTIHYLATSASNGVTTSTYGWTTTPQSVTSTKRYLWIYHTYTKGDNSTTDSDPVIAGVWGNTGDSGVSISGITNYYLATSVSSGITRSTSGWTTSIQTMTATNQYLWNYERITGSDGSTLSESEPVIIGRYGQNGGNGRGISSITEYYAVSSSNTTAPSVWANTMANTTTTNRYLWNYERIAYTDGTTADTTKRVIGTHGETGDDGVGITATTPLRYASSSSTTPNKPTYKVTLTSTAVGVWTTAIPALSNTYKYMFTCDQIEWDNGTITWSTVVQDNALTDLVTRVASAELKITEDAIVSTVRSSDSYKGDLASKNATFTGSYVPKSNNAPASSWNTTALKESHLNDTFITSGGELYQYISGHNGLMITFSSDSKTESVTYDYVRIYYKIGDTTYVLPDIGGTDISGASVFVPSNEFWLYWRSDRSQVYYGFRIASIDWVFSNTPTLTEATLPGIDPTPMSGTNYPETTHPYTNNEEKFWKYTNTSHSASVNPSYGWALRSDPNKTSASEVNSIIEQKADSIRLKADKISWQSTYSSMTEDGVLTCRGAAINGDVTMSGDDITVTVGDRYVPVSSGYGNPYSKQYLEGLLYEKNNSNNAKIAMKFLGYYDSANMLNESIVTSYYGYTRTITCNRVGSSGIPSDFNNSNACHVQEMLYQPSIYSTPTYHMTLYSGNFKRLAAMGLTCEGFGAVGYYNSDTTIQAELSVEYGKNIYCYNNIGGLVIEQSRTYIGKTRGGLPADSGVSGLFVYHPNGVTGYFTIGDVSGENHLYGSLNTNNPFLKHGGKYVQFQSSSSKRYKHDIKLLQDNALDPHKLLELPVKQFVYNDDIKLQYGDMRDKIIPGFIAEEVDEIYPIAIIHDIDGKVESWDERRIIPGMLSLIQELYEKIEDLERRL